jgi:hypothetical protein
VHHVARQIPRQAVSKFEFVDATRKFHAK